MERRQLGRGGAATRAGLAIAAPALIRSIPLFEGVDEHTLALLAEWLRPVRYEAGAEVVREGEPGAQLFVVATGEVEVECDGRVSVLREGDFFGELAVLAGGKRTATVRTTAPTKLYVLGRADFTRLLEREPAVRDAIRAAVVRRQRS